MGSHKSARPTLRDVARRADVSIWTASNAFSNPDRIADATRERVLTAADQLGYVGPNPRARALALGHLGPIALTTDGAADRLLSDPAAAMIAQGLLSSCAKAGRALVLSGAVDADASVEGHVLYRGTAATDDRRPNVAVLPAKPAVTPYVSADIASGAQELVAMLLELGHRTFAILDAQWDKSRLEQVGRHLRGPVHVIQTREPSAWPMRADGEAAARRALAAQPRPTALIALSDVVAFGALEAAHRMGLRVPDDITVVGIDDTQGSDMAGLTTVLVPYRPLGELAGELLLRQLDGERFDDAPPPLATALTIRRSAGPPPSRS